MTNTITEEVLKKIEEEYPLADKGSFISDFQNIAQVKLREAAIWGYGLSEGRIKELEHEVFAATDCYSDSQGEKALLKEENEKLQNRIKELEADNNQWKVYHKTEMDLITSKAIEAETDVVELQNKIKELEGEIERLEKIIDSIPLIK